MERAFLITCTSIARYFSCWFDRCSCVLMIPMMQRRLETTANWAVAAPLEYFAMWATTAPVVLQTNWRAQVKHQLKHPAVLSYRDHLVLIGRPFGCCQRVSPISFKAPFVSPPHAPFQALLSSPVRCDVVMLAHNPIASSTNLCI